MRSCPRARCCASPRRPGPSTSPRDPRARRAPPAEEAGARQAREQVADLGPRPAELQERLYAEGGTDGTRRVVVVLQAVDTGGKDVRSSASSARPPHGCAHHGVRAAYAEEQAHEFLWRVERQVPPLGYLGVLNLDDPTELERVSDATWQSGAPTGRRPRRRSRCPTDAAPWYVVPADRTWYREWAMSHLLLETLEELDPQYPARPDLDPEALRRELTRT